jgi:hypothetical protein
MYLHAVLGAALASAAPVTFTEVRLPITARSMDVLVVDLNNDGCSEVIEVNNLDEPDFVHTLACDALGTVQATRRVEVPMGAGADPYVQNGHVAAMIGSGQLFIGANRYPDWVFPITAGRVDARPVGSPQPAGFPCDDDQGTATWGAASGLVDRADLFPDLIVASLSTCGLPGVMLYRGNALGTWSTTPAIRIGSNEDAYAVVLADVVGDAAEDVVVANDGVNQVFESVRCPPGVRSFCSVPHTFGPDTRTDDVAVGDLDGDGASEVVSASRSGLGSVIELWSDELSVRATIGATVIAYGVELADVDGDADLDVLVATVDGALWFDNEAGVFVPRVVSRGVVTREVVGADVDGDGCTDLVVANFSDAVGAAVANSVFLSACGA